MTVAATVSKADGTAFGNEVKTALFSPSTLNSDLTYYGCSAGVKGALTYGVAVNPTTLGLAGVGNTISVNAQVLSPCVAGANYISGNASISQCQ